MTFKRPIKIPDTLNPRDLSFKPLSRPPPQHLVRGRALSSGELKAFGRKRGKVEHFKLLL
jgi:hypothetical protein